MGQVRKKEPANGHFVWTDTRVFIVVGTELLPMLVSAASVKDALEYYDFRCGNEPSETGNDVHVQDLTDDSEDRSYKTFAYVEKTWRVKIATT